MAMLVNEICRVMAVERVEAAVDRYVEALLTNVGVKSLPIPLEQVARGMGITRIDHMAIGCDGMLVPTAGDQYRVIIADWATPARQRFSLAHEIGHAIIHKLVPETKRFATRSVFMPPGHEAEERLCDLFASRILLPSSMICNEVNEGRISLAMMKRVSSRTGASLTAVTRRVSEMRRCPLALGMAKADKDGRILFSRVLAHPSEMGSRPRTGTYFRTRSVVASAILGNKYHCGWDWIPVSFSSFVRRFVECEGSWAYEGGQSLVLMAKQEFPA